MRFGRIDLRLVAVLALAVTAPVASAQKYDKEQKYDKHEKGERDDRSWLERCRDQDWGGGDRSRFCEVREYGMRPGSGVLTIDPDHNGGAIVRGWDRDSVHVSARIQTQASDDEAAEALAKEVEVSVGARTITVTGPQSRRRQSWSVLFEVMVPQRTDLAISTHNGPIGVTGVRGTMDLRTQNGPLTLRDVGGDVRGRAQNGPLYVTLSGRSWDGTGLDAETQNGPVVISIPEGYSARLETGTVNGPLSVGFPITVQGRNLNKRLVTDLGNGGATVRAVTTNGPVSIRRGDERD